MKILMTGGTGFVGNHLGRRLVEKGHRVVALTRAKSSALSKLSYPCDLLEWDGQSEVDLSGHTDIEAVFHLAGEGVADGRWNSDRKKKLWQSRVTATRNLVTSLKSLRQFKVFVSTSASGFYGDRGAEVLDEKSDRGVGFLSDLCAAWEREAQGLHQFFPKARLVIPRMGVVLGANRGFLDRLEPVFRSGAGGTLGSGRQYVSWIHIDDLTLFFLTALDDLQMQGVYNLSAPHPVTNRELTQALSKAYRMPAVFPVPAMVLKAMFGEMSTVLLGSQRVQPERLRYSGFRFKFETMDEALKDLYGHLGPGEAQYEIEQWVPLPPEKVWPFFADEKNLERITPSLLHFRVLKKNTVHLEMGTEIEYALKIHGIPTRWRARISQWRPFSSFIDEQLKGPYKKWHHLHEFVPLGSGTLLKDRVIYQLPLGILGRVVSFAFVYLDIKKIFIYRAQKTITLLGTDGI